MEICPLGGTTDLCVFLCLIRRKNYPVCHSGLDPESSVFLDSRLRGNDNSAVTNDTAHKKRKKYIERLTKERRTNHVIISGSRKR
jgi:hypothetical protein